MQLRMIARRCPRGLPDDPRRRRAGDRRDPVPPLGRAPAAPAARRRRDRRGAAARLPRAARDHGARAAAARHDRARRRPADLVPHRRRAADDPPRRRGAPAGRGVPRGGAARRAGGLLAVIAPEELVARSADGRSLGRHPAARAARGEGPRVRPRRRRRAGADRGPRAGPARALRRADAADEDARRRARASRCRTRSGGNERQAVPGRILPSRRRRCAQPRPPRALPRPAARS